MTSVDASFESALIALCRRPVARPVRARAAVALLDWLGCVLAARHEPVARALARGGAGVEGDPLRAALRPAGLDAQGAALLAGGLGNVLEMDDLHRASLLHAGDTICPAALASALRRPTSGAALLDALVRGYECGIRIGLAVAAGGYTPFYNSGTCGVFGAAMAVAALRGLDGDGMADALGQAGMMAGGIWQCRLEPTWSKQLACAHAARAGVLAADLAATGFPGARAILTGEMGFFASYYPMADPADMVADPEGPWKITEVSVKPFPACRHTHPAISAALELRPRVEAADIARIEVHTYDAALGFCDQPAPQTAHDARFSLQHAVAVTLCRGAPGIADFAVAARRDPAVSALRERVSLHTAPDLDAAFPGQLGARLRITDTAGRMHEADCPAAWGDPEHPLTEAEVIAKFRANAAHGGVPPEAVAPLVDSLLALPDSPDLTPLSAALGAALSPVLEEA